MELKKTDAAPIEFVYKDVTFYVRPYCTALDKHNLNMDLGFDEKGERIIQANGQMAVALKKMYRWMARSFVVGWKGVTLDGKDMPYSFDLLERAFPVDPQDDVFFKLGEFIGNHVMPGLTAREAEAKNG